MEAPENLPTSLLALAELSDALVFVTAPTGVMAWCNQSFREKTGFTEEDFQFENDDNPFIHREDLPRVAEFLAEFAGSPERFSGVLRNRFVNRWGEVGHVRSRVAKIPWGDADAFLVVCHEQDHHHNDGGHDTEESYRSLVMNADDIIVKLDSQGRFLFANDRFRELTGLSIIEQGKASLVDLVHADEVEGVRAQIEAVSEQGDREILDIRLANVEGALREYHGGLVRYRSDDGSFVLQAILRDVTDSRRLQARIEQKQRLESLGLLAGGIAHDFNNLLTAILANSSLLLRSSEGESKRLVEDVIAAANRAATLAAEMLSYAGHAPAEQGTVDIAQVVGELPGILQAALENEIKLIARTPDEPAFVEGSAVQLTQIAMNLATNAAEASHSDGIVDLRVGFGSGELENAQVTIGNRPAGHVVYFEVRDKGCGMSPETLERVFDPFYTTKSGGRGLGMSAVLGIIENHRGAMLIHSEVGAGTTIRVELPRAFPDEASMQPPAEEPDGGLEQLSVLVVDDDALVRDVTSRVLEAAGHVAVTTSGGAEAIEVLKEDPSRFSVVLLDSMMPEMTGPETRKVLSRLSPSLPIVTMSGWRAPSEEPAEIALDKPFTPQRLVEVVRLAARSRRKN